MSPIEIKEKSDEEKRLTYTEVVRAAAQDAIDMYKAQFYIELMGLIDWAGY